MAAFVLSATSVSAQTSPSYKGFFDIELSGQKADGVSAVTFGAETSHGVFVRNRFFLGAGLGVEMAHTAVSSTSAYYSTNDTEIAIPVFGQARVYFSDDRVRPFFDVKAGYCFKDVEGILFSPTLGFTMPVCKKLAVNFGISYSLLAKKYDDSLFSHANERDKVHSFSLSWGFEF